MGFESFLRELEKVAQAVPPAQAGTLSKIRKWIHDNPGKSGIATGWILRGLLTGRDE